MPKQILESRSSSSTDAKQPVTYKIYMNRGEVNYPEDGGEGKKLMLEGLNKAGITGVDFKVSLTGGQEYFTKLNLMIASGDVPDYFSVDLPTMTKLAGEGLIMPLDDMLKKMPNASKYYKPQDLQAGMVNGKIYAFPDAIRPEPFNGQNVNGFVGRLDWLKKIGAGEPKTLDQLYDVLKAFTMNDPDGNGKKDTYGLGGTKPGAFGSVSGFDGIFGAFGVAPSFWHERNGTIRMGMVLPETKQALTLLQKWYKEGLIDPEFPVTTDKQLDEKMTNSKVGIVGKNAWLVQPTNSASYKALQKLVPGAELGVIVPPTGPGETAGRRQVPEAAA
ncbi:extracellular solute-binding protein [Paenibacillus sp. CC-CFT747]|nr:extracellular solute-binding protein [Paenibacillus sp. CC-CFT747]